MAAASPIELMAGSFLDPAEDAAVTALVQYLRSEADLADQKAVALRTQADALAAAYSVTPALQQRYELDASELPPLDEHGVPKYKGKKRGRKPRLRKRRHNPDRPKRQHTAYTLFVQETYPSIKSAHTGRPSKDLIGIVAKEWAAVPESEKKLWKERALKTHNSDDAEMNNDNEEEQQDDDDDDDDADEVDNEEQEEDEEDLKVAAAEAMEELEHDSQEDEALPPARRRRRK